MDWNGLKERIPEQVKKYRYILLVVLSGILLMSLPDKPARQEKPETKITSEIEAAGLQEQLEDILSQVAGAGRVRVLLTQSAGEEILYQSDEDVSTQEHTDSVRQKTVTVTDGQRAEQGLIRQIIPPRYMGAVVLCQGAEQATVRLAISDAVSSVTGLSFDKITVLKMK